MLTWKSPSNETFTCVNTEEAAFMWKKLYQENEYGGLIKYHSGATIVDCGGNIGMYARFAHDACQHDANIHVYEPMPELNKCLKKNAPFAILHEYALSSQNGTIKLDYLPMYTMLSGVNAMEEESKYSDMARGIQLDIDKVDKFFCGETVETPAFTLSSAFADIPQDTIDVLKVDIEGMEWEVLQTLTEEDWARVKQVVIEVHCVGDRVQQINECLQSAGFTTFVTEASAPSYLLSLVGRDEHVNAPNINTCNVFGTRAL